MGDEPVGGSPRELRSFAELPRGVAPLGYRNFALYWIGFATSNSGKWIEQTGAVWLMYELTRSPLLLGLLGVSSVIPALVLGPLAGVVADRVDQRRLMFVTQGLGLLTSLGLGVLVAMGLVQFWHLYVQVAMQSAIQTFDGAARQALFPRLVPRPRLAEAVTLSATAARSAALVGPSIGGVAIAVWGGAAPFLLNAATFPVLMAAVTWMRGVPPRPASASSSILGELTEGLHYILKAPVLSGLLKLEGAFAVFAMNAVMITIVARDVLGVGPEGLGALLSAPGLGSIFGLTFLIVLGQRRRQGRFVLLCSFAYAAALVGFAASRNFALSFVALVITGLFDVLQTVTRQSVMQLATPGRMRGRVVGNMRIVSSGLSSVAQVQSGILAGALGSPLAVVSAAAALAAIAGAIARTNRELWAFSREAQPLESAATSGDVVA